MKHPKLLFALLIFNYFGFAQSIIYNETFTNSPNKGAIYNNTTGLTDIDLSGVNWTIDVSGAAFDNNGDRFIVAGNPRFFEGRDIDGFAIWYSPVLNITDFTDITFELEAYDNRPTFDDFEASDSFTTEYSLDGGAWQIADTNGVLVDDIDTVTLVRQVAPLSGNTIAIRVTMRNNANAERYRLDNIKVRGVASASPRITINPDTNLVSGLTNVEGNVDIVPETFTVLGTSLTNDVVITAPSSFEISLSPNGAYSNSLTLALTGTTVDLTTIYTKLTYGLAVGTYNENIIITSTGAPSQNVIAQGEVFGYTAPSDCSSLLISEYHEANNATPDERYIELYNASSSPISLANFQLARFTSGRINFNPTIRTLPNAAVIAPYSTYIIARNGSELCANGTADYCNSSGFFNFDGNDVIALQTAEGVNIDVIGVLNSNTNFAQNVNLVRNNNVQAPSTTYTATDWTSSPSNNINFLGYHISDCACSGPIVTWDGSTWSNGVGPNINTPVVINGPFTTGVGSATSFSACRLTINATTIITSNFYIEVEHNINNTNKLVVQTEGTLVQNNETTKFINNSSETFPIEVVKRTAPFVAWYEYTYWGSPLADAILEDLVPNTASGRKFTFNGANFNDALAEDLGNNNTYTAGQDDVDDEGDDWQFYATGLMTPGVGYATTMSEIDLAAPGAMTNGINLTFFGSEANSGVVKVPVARNDASNLDNNWQFIGNPYPSAIDATAFFNENTTTLSTVDPGVIDGAIYYWSQATPPSATTIGNEQINFSINDYAIINFSANVAGERYAPNNFIPSGQGFFVNFSDSYSSAAGEVVFNNSMRVIGNNDQFFRTENTNLDNKLWLNLTSDNGVFSQVAIAYLDGSTNNDDGPSYDARRYYSGGSAMITTFAENNDIPLAIQGKHPEGLDLDETIRLGLTTGITSPTIYTISIDHFQGDFFSSNAIYLKDNFNDTYQDLTVSDYSFTSEMGGFDNRFEIVFTQPVLSINQQLLASNSLSIIEDNNSNVTFKLSNKKLTINTIQIYDALGRLVYNLKGQSTSETYNLSNLSQEAYIAQIELNTGQKIRKKAIKK
ncbi:lamin tail domain-containing protein [Olleya namhaensis]|uniref:Por secretion system C-terminal sorting domain-containing protein n=1 Tax=Olleya namhaensis TaxID=1144750 RepID=A0A1I3J4Y8_9FLAO|nr:lamin tail domain-containing protein [Olleya namhaensis]SFI54975.1 Por secretion system C-terminal sorting domain-containing protein [Olleya namhaensis]